MQDEEKDEEPVEDNEQAAEQEGIENDALKDTDTLPSEAIEAKKSMSNSPKKEETPTKKKKIIGLMGIEHDVGPPGSTHG